MNVLLSRDETYADISPVRLNSNGVTAFVASCGAAIICVRFVWCHLHVGVKEAVMRYSIVKEAKIF